MKKLLTGLAVTLIAITALILIPSPQPSAPMPWEITLMPDGNIKVFGIHLGTTTYRQAQQQLHEFGTLAVFTQDDQPATVEAYFPTIHLGGLSGKMILNLQIRQEAIPAMLSHAMEARIQPSGARKYALSHDDNVRLLQAAIIAITYIPSVKLDAAMLRYRFGEPAAITSASDAPQTQIWQYPRYGLTIRLHPGEKTLLEYTVKH